MKKIKNIGISVLMLMGVINFAFASSDVLDGAVIEGVTTFDAGSLTAIKLVNVPTVIWSRHLGINSALTATPKGFGGNAGELISGALTAGDILNLTLRGALGTNNHMVSDMLFLRIGPTGNWTFTNIVNNPLDTTIPPVFGGLMFSSNVIAATAAALVKGDGVRTEIGSVLIYNSTTKTVDVVDEIVVSLTRL